MKANEEIKENEMQDKINDEVKDQKTDDSFSEGSADESSEAKNEGMESAKENSQEKKVDEKDSDKSSESVEESAKDLKKHSKQELVKMIKELDQQKANIKNDLLRERADFVNYKKRSLAEKDDLKYYISGNLLSSLLPAMDSFDQLFSQDTQKETDVNKYIEGVKMIQKQIISSFEEYGLESIHPEGEEFDPSLMEALNVQESDEVEKETVMAVFQKGYKINGKIIRPARVMVMKPSQKKKENNNIEEQTEDKK